MNLSIKNINNCHKLDDYKINNLLNKLNIKNNYDINDINNNRTIICNAINKKAKDIIPCSLLLYSDTDLNLKKHQLNVSNHLVKNRGVVVVHSVGTGKTLTAVASAQCLLLNKNIDHVIVITPTSLQKNFISQALMYGLTNDEIDSNYTFYTIQGIVNSIENKTAINPNNSLIIIDEAHNLRTLGGSRYDTIFKYSKKASKILLLSATPLINYNYDIINLISLIRGEKPISIDKFNEMLISNDKEIFQKYVEDIFSYYIKDSLNPDVNFPDKKILEIFLQMDTNYLKTCIDIENGQVGKIPDFKGKNIHVFYNGLRRASNIIEKKSPKVDWIIKKIKSEKKAKFVIFSHFLNMGIIPIMKWLNKNNISYSFVTGDLTIEERSEAVTNYNNETVKILFISKAGSEGLDLKNTTNIIIMEPAWNESSIEQIIGRGVRYKSHEDLPKSKKLVTIYKLYLIKPFEYKNINIISKNYLLEYEDNMLSVDLYLRNYSWLKQQSLISFDKLLSKYKIEK